MPIDAELLRRYVETRAEDAFAELVRRHVNLVYFSALRQLGGDTHTAEEVAQSVFTDLARKARSLSQREVLANWLHTSTRFAAAKARRTQARRRKHETEAEIMQAMNRETNPAADWETLRPLIDDVVHELDARDRGVVLLRFFEDRPFAEIGAACGLSEDAARMRVERALEKMRLLLARRGVTSTGAALGLMLANQAAYAAPAGLATSVTGAALASAGAAPAMGLVSFMSTSKMAASTAVAVFALGIGGAGYQLHERGLAEKVRVALQQENDALTARLHAQRERAKAAELALAERQKTLDAEKAEQQRAARAAGQARQANARAAGEAFMARHPEVWQAAIENSRTRVAGRYALLFQSLRLTPAQIERFKDIEIQGLGGSITGTNGGESMSYRFAGDREQKKADMRALLGEEGFRRYQNWDFEGAGHHNVVQLASALYSTSSPLTAEQGAALQRIVSDAWVPVEWSSMPQFDWDSIMTKARAVLTEPQLAQLGYLQAQDRFSQGLAQSRHRNLNPATTNK